jgi:endonuclease YncB( thermonuclease family)
VRNLKKGAYRRLFLLPACLLPLATLAETACPAEHVDEYSRVKYVHDGDTVHLEDGRKIRLIGINTPELARDSMPEQARAQAARAFLAKVLSVHGNRVGLVYGRERHDRHRRTLAHLFSPEGDNVQAQLLQQGLAAAIAHPPNLAYSDCYAQQEWAARCAGRGIWPDPEHAALRADDLGPGDRGFQRVSGRVERVSQSDRGVWLFMSDLMIAIRDDDMDHFNRAALLSLQGRHLTVRGWLHPSSRKKSGKKSYHNRSANYFMRIRHPSAIETMQADSDSKC